VGQRNRYRAGRSVRTAHLPLGARQPAAPPDSGHAVHHRRESRHRGPQHLHGATGRAYPALRLHAPQSGHLVPPVATCTTMGSGCAS
jgi:hypothetical protein